MPGRWFRRAAPGGDAGQGSIRMRSTAAVRVEECLADYAEALALAEAGEQLLAGAVIRRGEAQVRRILVLGHGCGLSSRLAGYALSLAGRMGSGLLFLHVGDAAHDAYRRAAFERQARAGALEWVEAARARGMAALHEVRFAPAGRPDHAVEEAARAHGRVELILSEPEESELMRGRTGLALFTVE
ncbi:hypothetical protein [Nitratidesulfovibrio sp. 1201_IL3209]|uniref:hypothetical protein n=1 Tax=Nitratidesulfovibrio sp. 1201_IL3209 TaxID=3084053 RepID=UPI002FD9FEFB